MEGTYEPGFRIWLVNIGFFVRRSIVKLNKRVEKFKLIRYGLISNTAVQNAGKLEPAEYGSSCKTTFDSFNKI
jgi:hypothetical protein